MAGEDELSQLFSSISSPPDDINSLLTADLSLEQIHQILSIPDSRPRTESLSVSSPESGISSSGDLSEDQSHSPWAANSVTLHQYQEEYHDNTPHYVKMDSETSQFYSPTQHYQSQDDMASILKQLTTESSELLIDSQVDLERLERVKNNFKTTTLITGDNFPVAAVTVSGPNHMDSHQQPQQQHQSVIVRNVQASPTPPPPPQIRTYTNEQFSVDFPSQIVINIPPRETKMSNIPVTIMELGEGKDDRLFQNFEIVAPKKEVQEYLCYCCGEKAGKHSYYGGQVCASCRAFFRRSVQSKYYEIFQCKFDKSCKITSQTRKTCQFCR